MVDPGCADAARGSISGLVSAAGRGAGNPEWLPELAGSGAIRHHAVLTESLGIKLRRPPSDTSLRHFFHQEDVAALCAAIRDWTIVQIPGGAADLDQLVCDGKPLRGSIEPSAAGGSTFIAQATLYSGSPEKVQTACVTMDLSGFRR